MNTTYFERLNEQNILQMTSKDDLLTKIKTEYGIECLPNTPKSILIIAILDFKYGKEINNEEKPKIP